MTIPIPAHTPDPNLDDPVIPPTDTPPIPEQDPLPEAPEPMGDPPTKVPPIKASAIL